MSDIIRDRQSLIINAEAEGKQNKAHYRIKLALNLGKFLLRVRKYCFL